MGRTQEERRAETRAQLLAAAADLFARKGFHATSTEAVAAAADRTTGALYDHFDGKQGLLVALLELWIGQTMVDLGERVEAAPDVDGRLGELWRGLIRRDAESGDAWLLLEFELWLHAARDPELSIVGAERLAMMRDELATALARWSTDLGFELPAPAPHLAAQFIALLVGAAFQHRLEPATVTQEVVVDGLRRLLGLSADSRGDAP
jgi:AcrR family transcriptional regulator